MNFFDKIYLRTRRTRDLENMLDVIKSEFAETQNNSLGVGPFFANTTFKKQLDELTDMRDEIRKIVERRRKAKSRVKAIMQFKR
jgi:hypothetical protein